MTNTNFSETQRFRQPWIWVVLILTVAAGAGSALYPLFTAQPASGGLAAAVIGVLVPVTLVVFFFLMRLETTIDGRGVSYRFFPVHTRERLILWEEIAEVQVRKYSPLREYGGWGIRTGFGKSGLAFNVRGDMGIQLVLKNGKKILIGTQQPEAVTAALQQLGKL